MSQESSVKWLHSRGLIPISVMISLLSIKLKLALRLT
jgi:hypothetical protein